MKSYTVIIVRVPVSDQALLEDIVNGLHDADQFVDYEVVTPEDQARQGTDL